MHINDKYFTACFQLFLRRVKNQRNPQQSFLSSLNAIFSLTVSTQILWPSGHVYISN